MGFSGNRGAIYWLGDSCPTLELQADFSYQPVMPVTDESDNTTRYPDEVTRFVIEDRVEFRKYGHDKSGGGKDICTGTWEATITVDAVANKCVDNDIWCRAGQVVFMQLYPFGLQGEAQVYQGYAALVRRTKTVDIDTGKPVEYTAIFESKFKWEGLPGDNSPTGGFECAGACASVGPDGSIGSLGQG